MDLEGWIIVGLVGIIVALVGVILWVLWKFAQGMGRIW